jgi:hypothetical protein
VTPPRQASSGRATKRRSRSSRRPEWAASSSSSRETPRRAWAARIVTARAKARRGGPWRLRHSSLGLQQETAWPAGIDLNWIPLERVAFSAYTYEQLFQKIRSRSRPVTGTTTFDFVDFDWISDLDDTVHTAYAGVRAALIPRVLDFRIDANYSYAKLGYAFVMFNKTDWRTDTLNPFIGVSSIWLGNNLRDYTAHMMGASVTYRFE